MSFTVSPRLGYFDYYLALPTLAFESTNRVSAVFCFVVFVTLVIHSCRVTYFPCLETSSVCPSEAWPTTCSTSTAWKKSTVSSTWFQHSIPIGLPNYLNARRSLLKFRQNPALCTRKGYAVPKRAPTRLPFREIRGFNIFCQIVTLHLPFDGTFLIQASSVSPETYRSTIMS